MMKRKLVVATRSSGKLPEIISLLQGLSYDVVNLSQIPALQNYSAEEPARTIEGNGIIKAMTYGWKTGSLTLADDVGLEVDVLGGKPGVHTARYAAGTDRDRCIKLLTELRNVPDGQRTARFRSIVAIFDPAIFKIRTCEGVDEGCIVRETRGEHGFGYDPIFFSKQLQKTSAEMTQDEKNAVSHRGAALREARRILELEFSSPSH